MALLRYIFLFFALVQCKGLHLLSGKRLGPKPFKKNEDIPQICRKANFMKNFIETATPLDMEALNKLGVCTKYYPHCGFPKNVSATYEESNDGKLFISLTFEDSIKESTTDCWGYLINMNEGRITKTQFFMPVSAKKTYKADVYIKLAFEYQFEVIPLPLAEGLVLNTTSPNRCQLGVLDDLYSKILSSKACHNANSLPSYKERFQIAKAICKKYPKKRCNRSKAILNQVFITNDCELRMSNSFTNESTI